MSIGGTLSLSNTNVSDVAIGHCVYCTVLVPKTGCLDEATFNLLLLQALTIDILFAEDNLKVDSTDISTVRPSTMCILMRDVCKLSVQQRKLVLYVRNSAAIDPELRINLRDSMALISNSVIESFEYEFFV